MVKSPVKLEGQEGNGRLTLRRAFRQKSFEDGRWIVLYQYLVFVADIYVLNRVIYI